MISLIFAMDRNRLIGKGNEMPWRYPEDLKYLRKMTENKTVLMGRKTYESLLYYYKNKPLPYGKIFVASHTLNSNETMTVVKDIHVFLTQNHDEEVFVMGGSHVFEQAIPYADRIYITYIDAEHEGDVFFPPLDLTSFLCTKKVVSGILTFAVYDRGEKHV